MERDDSWWQQQDIEELEKEVIETLSKLVAAGLVEEAEILASAAGVLPQLKKTTQYMEHRR